MSAWNPDYALVIDPTYKWHTFYGSTGNDEGYGIAVTADAVYVTGISGATWNGDGGLRTGPFIPDSGGGDIVVLKLDSAGVYQWHTFYGSANSDVGNSIAVSGDAVYVTGTSVASWNGDGATIPKHAHSGQFFDIVVLKAK